MRGFLLVTTAVFAVGCSSGGGGTGGGSGGGTGGGGIGGGSGGGGGGAAAGGVVTFDTFAFYNPQLVSGADGVLHLAFNTNTSPSTVQYSRCAANCAVGANWTTVIVGTDQFTGSTRLVVGTDNRVHLLYDVSRTGGAFELIYATCATNCTQAASWTKTDLASLFAGSWDSPARGSPLVIDAQNRLSFTVDRKIYLNGGLSLATCAADCSTLANWSTGTIRSSGTRTSLVAAGTTLHQLVDDATTSASATSLAYRTCSANCTQAASWQELPNLFVYDGQMPTAIAVTPQGGVRVAYNQGPSAASQPSNIKAQDNRFLFWSCDANCLQLGSWSGLMMGAVGDGEIGIAMKGLGGALVLSITNSDKVFTRACEQSCLTAANWQVAEIDSSTAMTADYDPTTFTAATCSGNPPLNATWHMGNGVLAIRPDGSIAFAHAVSILRTCPGSTSVVYIPGYGRLVYLP